MADTPIPVLLNQGLDTVTPPLLMKEGALIDCLNYEMTGDVGYRRIDGYERYDGYPNGNITRFYTVNINAEANQASVAVGSTIALVVPTTSGVSVVGDPATNDVGIIVAVNGGTSYTYIPFSAEGVLGNGASIYVRSLAGTQFTATTTSASVDGKNGYSDPEAYLDALRSYSSVLRNLVSDAPYSVAGMWVYKNNLYAAIAAPILSFIFADKLNFPLYPGALIRFSGVIYRVLANVDMPSDLAPAPGEARIALIPVGTSGVNDTQVVEVDASDTAISVISTAPGNGLVTTEEWAYIVRFETAATSTKRGFTALSPSYRIPFDAGTYTSETLPKTGWTLRNAAGTKTMSVRLVDVVKTSGTFAAGSAAGYVVVTELKNETGGSSMEDNWELHYDGSRRMTVNAINRTLVLGTRIAGPKRLLAADTRYHTISANFYGNASLRTVYGATGASRGFWADYSYFGNIYTQDDESLDQPKYAAYHAGRLALGYEVGSVLRSKVGSPLNFLGAEGAQEIATGDILTGLLELPGNALAAFGANSIRTIDASGSMATISSGAGCFDYTAVMVGHIAMFTSMQGVSTLEQSAAYGDFEGKRSSAQVQTWLRTRLLVDNNGFESGGVAMALPVRNKNQYRLFFKNGEVLVITNTSEGPKATKSNYGIGNDLRVPFAWSSSVSDDKKERIFVVWDNSLAAKGVRGVVGTLPEKDRVYELDSGWGFDGAVFPHYFDTAHVFINGGTQYTGIDKVRLHGQGYGAATLVLRASGIEDDYDQGFSEADQDISLPATPVILRDSLGNFTSIVDHANYGLGIKLRVEGNGSETEPSHICQVLIMHARSEGALDA